MKNFIFFSLFVLFFVTGCTHKQPITNNTQKPLTTNSPIFFESLFPSESGSSSPKITITIGTGLDYSRLHEDQIPYISGYIYTYIYEDMGIKITTPSNLEPYFSQKTDSLIFKRHKNIIYRSGSSNQAAEYIQAFTKDPSLSLYTVIQQKHLRTGCMIYSPFQNSNFTTNDNFFENQWSGFDPKNFFKITGPDSSLSSEEECYPDTEFPHMFSLVFFVQSKYHKDRYYKISMFDGCAPGPCSIFGKIEFF